MINTARNKGNWEARCSNITYKEALEIKQNSNVREIGISHKISKTENLSQSPFVTLKFDIREYDYNALRNANIHLTDGRLPENSNEIIVSITKDYNNCLEKKIRVGEEVELTVAGEKKEYKVVRDY